MRVGTYGLATSIRGPQGVPGGSLTANAITEQAQATDMLGRAAEMETQRNIANQQNEQAAKAGGASLGASAGAIAGMSFGPWGALAGGLLGAIAGNELF